MAAVIAKIAPAGGPLSLDLHLGDGVSADWTVRLEGIAGASRVFTGSSADPLPDQVQLPATVVGQELTWMAVFFGPAKAADYHYSLRMSQDGRQVLERAIKGSGTVKARRTKVVTGTISLELA